MDSEFIIITGMSGAGKSVAVRSLEDVGYYCIDNLPFQFMPELFRLEDDAIIKNRKVACVVDIRTGDSLNSLGDTIKEMKEKAGCRVIFLDTRDDRLLARYKETRRVHPVMLQTKKSLEDSIRYERQLLESIRGLADYVVDTTFLSNARLRKKILSFVVSDEKQTISIEVVSFGYKHGLPRDADIVFDVRCVKNPFYVPELKKKTGLDSDVDEYVFSDENSSRLLKLQEELLELSIPLYVNEGKGHLTICYGCTGGNHRSVCFAERMYSFISEMGYNCSVHHRDIQRGR